MLALVATAALTEPPKIAEPATSTMQAPLGSVVERDQFRVSRRLPSAPAGLTLLHLDAAVLARDPALRDVRLVDSNGRQVPYLIEPGMEPLTLPLDVPARAAAGRSSVYRLPLHHDTWPVGTRLVVTTSSKLFERPVTLRRGADNHRNRRASTITQATWRNTEPTNAPASLQLDFSLRGARTLELVIDDGDNAPLPVASAYILLPAYSLRFHHPGTELFLLYGNRRAGEPRYDLTLLSPALAGDPLQELRLPPPVHLREQEEEAPARKLFWVAIGVAAVVLIVMLARMLSAETSRAPTDSR